MIVDLKGLGTDHVTFCLGTEEEQNLMQRKPFKTISKRYCVMPEPWPLYREQ